MGKVKYLDKIRELLKKSPVVDINSLKRVMEKKDKKYIHLLINNLLKKKEIKQITKGYYSLEENSNLLLFTLKPAYLGLQDAMSFYGIWEQETVPVIVTTRNVRTGIRQVFGANALIRKINKKYFFGLDYFQENNYALPYSDIEKTFIDMVHFKQPLDKEAIKEFKKQIDKAKLKEYLQVYPNKTKKRILKLLAK